MAIKFRTLKANEIEVRTQQIKENGVSVLLYKTARTDANLLDETVGPENWQNDFKSIDGKMFGFISIKCGDEWVSKSDSGSEGNIEAEKSLASDAFKRAGFKWGIGRELYTAPFIWISSDVATIKQYGQKYNCNDKFSVKHIAYNDNREIIALEIVNQKNKVVYTFGTKTPIVMQKNDDTEEKKEPINKLSSNGVSVQCQREINDADTLVALTNVFKKYEHTEPLEALKSSCAAKKELLITIMNGFA